MFYDLLSVWCYLLSKNHKQIVLLGGRTAVLPSTVITGLNWHDTSFFKMPLITNLHTLTITTITLHNMLYITS